ncbi:MAG TPA: ABC transporter ATP-binding protein [bacterium]|nr:ABC transporter ATP-binding protein [bacterium]
MLAIDRLNTGYGSVQVLWDVSLRVDEGEVVALIGPNGAGKSTLLRTVSGLLRPWGGTLRFDTAEITAWSPEEIVRCGVAQVPQGRRLFPDLTIRENLLLGAYARRDRAAVGNDLRRVLELFPRIAGRIDAPASQFSGGEQQMVALGRALMARPRLLLIDEPSLGLAPIVVQAVMEVVARLRTEGTSVLLVEQDVPVALTHADRGYVLETGRIVLHDTADVLLRSPRIRETYLGLAPSGASG